MDNSVQIVQFPRLVLFLIGTFVGIGASHYLGVQVAAPLLVVLIATQIVSAPKRIPQEEPND